MNKLEINSKMLEIEGIKEGYVAMNKGLYDLENMSFFNTKQKAKKFFGGVGAGFVEHFI